MRITTWNVNGLRAALRKGFSEYLNELDTDVLLLQEIRVLPEQLPIEWQEPAGWYVHWHPAHKKGYAGTAIWARRPFRVIETGTSAEDSDEEGRLLSIDYEGVRLSSVYLPSGSSSVERQSVKEDWMVRFRKWADDVLPQGPVLMGGDLNVAHTERDIFYAKSNEKTSGFLPHERQWFGELLSSGWYDLTREHFGDVQGPYSWWSNRGRARELDRGWRIDYLLANKPVYEQFQSATIHREAGLAVSDHAPVSIDISI